MKALRNYNDKLRRYGAFSSKEIKGLVLTTIVLAFIFSFRNWGTETFDIGFGIANFILAIIIVGIAIYVHEMAHRMIALRFGYRIEYKTWIFGLIGGLLLTFLTNGNILFIAPGTMLVYHLGVHRLGQPYYALNYRAMGWIGMAGPLANVFLALIAKALLFLPIGSGFLEEFMRINLWIAIFSMIPIPPFNGAKTFFGSRYIYILVTGFILAIAYLLFTFDVLAAFFGALAFGIILLGIYFVWIDKMFK